jgi:hypothetical protein
MKNEMLAEIDFETWARLAREDPQAFEERRLEAIAEVIDSAPERSRERLRCLQWRIDQERRLARTPLAACMRISQMMWRSVLGDGGLQQRLGDLQRAFGVEPDLPVAPTRTGSGSADVLAFARARD